MAEAEGWWSTPPTAAERITGFLVGLLSEAGIAETQFGGGGGGEALLIRQISGVKMPS